MLRALLGAALGGLLGAALWAAVAYFFHYEIGWIAWGVGVAAGFGAAKFGDQLDGVTGAAAAGIAVLSIFVGKLATVHLMVDDSLAQITAENISDELAISYIADEVAVAYREEGLELDWPKGVDPELAEEKSDYPRDVWKDAEAAWKDCTPQERKDFKGEISSNIKAGAVMFRDEAVLAGFKDSFGVFDVLFVLLAIGSAYKLGRGEPAAPTTPAA